MEDDALPPAFDWFSLRVLSCGACHQPQVLLAMGHTDDDLPIRSLHTLAPQVRVPAYAIICRAGADRARVRKVFPNVGEYVLTAAQWERILASVLGQHRCPARW